MKSINKRLGDNIQLVDKRNVDLRFDRLLGINITKNFMPSVANVSGIDFSKYKIVKKGQFVCNLMHVGRDERLPVALYRDNEEAIVSPAYQVFEVIDTSQVIPEFLMIEFQRPEFDRYTWFICDSSIRGGLEWERFCEIQIPIPDITKQRNYVSLYNGLLSNQKSFESSLKQLQIISNSLIEKLKNSLGKKPLGKYIQIVDERNSDSEINRLLGININKSFMPSAANSSGLDLSKYKIIRKGRYACNIMHVGRDEMLPVSLFGDDDLAIVSPAYITFEVINPGELFPEFLMLIFQRPEFDRYTWFVSDSSVRGGLEWDRFCEIEIPIPDVKIQKSLVSLYNIIERRRAINDSLKDLIKPLCPVLMKGVVDSLITN